MAAGAGAAEPGGDIVAPVAEIELYTTDCCSFCRRAKGLLEKRGIAFREVFVSRDDLDGRLAMARRTGLTTMPQVVVDGRAVGGWDDLQRLEAAGRLREALLG
jgi:glutaredoxin 3